MDINQEIATAIKAHIEASRTSRLKLSEDSAIPYATLNRKLNGGGDFTFLEVARISRALDVQPHELMPREYGKAKDVA